MATPRKLHQAVSGVRAGETFVTSLCDAGRDKERLVVDVMAAPYALRCGSCVSRLPWAGGRPVVLVDLASLTPSSEESR